MHIQTDVPCVTVRERGVSIRATGATATLPDATVLATSAVCTDGVNGQPNDVGTLVFVPTSGTPQVSLRVVLGVDVPTDACGPVSSGCIVAERRIAYEKHSTLELPIRLDGACIGRVCADGKTCSAGVCVSSESTCSGASCETDDASTGTPPVKVVPDGGGVVDAGPTVLDAGVCPPASNVGCGCEGKTASFCCLAKALPTCTVSREACVTSGGCPL